MVTRYKCDAQTSVPRPVECAEVGHPHPDAEGDVQFENTHFDDLGAAWAAGRQDAEAAVSLAGSAVKNAESQLAEARREAGDAAVRFHTFLAAERRARQDVL